MAEKKDVFKKLSRRDFVRGATVGVAGVAATGALAGCGAEPEVEVCPGIPTTWDQEADVVVVGYGGGGAAAAIEAHDKDANVLVIEKAPEEHAGGNSAVCCGGMSIPPSPELGLEHYNTIGMGTVKDEAVTRAFIEGLMSLKTKLEDIGAEPTETISPATGYAMVRLGQNGADAYKVMSSLVKDRGIEVLYETPMTGLIQHPGTKEILGVQAKTADGQTLTIKAKKGVVLACGGYENNPEMQGSYNIPGIRSYPWGTPYNTGDGIKAVQAVGAQLWHTSCVEWAPFCIKAPSDIYECAFSLPTSPFADAGYVFVNKNGSRFMNEAKSLGHTKEQLAVNDIYSDLYAIVSFQHEGVGFVNQPFYMLYDQKLQEQGPIWTPTAAYSVLSTFAAVHNMHEWSADNSAEIDKGWIVKADSLTELADKIGIDAAALQTSVDKYNAYCESQQDLDFGKPAANLVPIDSPPYYMTELGLSWINTQGGPQHNAKQQVVDKDYGPIDRLYAAGEFGSFFGGVYHGANNFPESFASGFIAGENAAMEEPWE